MITTNQSDYFNVRLSDSTVYVSPGTARISDSVMEFRGAYMTLGDIANFSGDSSRYQYAMLYLTKLGGEVDMTKSVSSTSSSMNSLIYPTFPSDSSCPYPVALMTLWTPDGTQIDVLNLSKVF